MEDQAMALKDRGIAAVNLSASSSKEEVKLVHQDMIRPAALKLLYVTPEKIAKSKRFMAQLQKAYEKGLLASIAIDEVHCCSQWGHDFRPDYKVLGILKRQFCDSPIIGLTATASTSVLEDVKEILNMPACEVFRASYNRANLFYEVRPKPSGTEFNNQLARMLQGEFANQSGIIYCFSRKETENLAADLVSRGIMASPYHAYMEPEERSTTHRNWKRGHLQVVVATTAFGMGIDKPDVRFVIHHSLSKSMENYYQESGRAGRDGKKAKCILFFAFVDVFRQSTMVVMEQTGLSKLYQMVAYCISKQRCRRILLAEHFDETWERGVNCNGMCDACRTHATVKELDVTQTTKTIYNILEKCSSKEERLTGLKLVDQLVKSEKQKGIPVNGDWMKVYRLRLIVCRDLGVLRFLRERHLGSYGRVCSAGYLSSLKFSKDQYYHIILHLLLEGYLKEDFHFTPYSTISYFCPGPKASHITSKVMVPIMTLTSTKKLPSKAKEVKGQTSQKPDEDVIILDGEEELSSGSVKNSHDWKEEADILLCEEEGDPLSIQQLSPNSQVLIHKSKVKGQSSDKRKFGERKSHIRQDASPSGKSMYQGQDKSKTALGVRSKVDSSTKKKPVGLRIGHNEIEKKDSSEGQEKSIFKNKSLLDKGKIQPRMVDIDPKAFSKKGGSKVKGSVKRKAVPEVIDLSDGGNHEMKKRMRNSNTRDNVSLPSKQILEKKPSNVESFGMSPQRKGLPEKRKVDSHRQRESSAKTASSDHQNANLHNPPSNDNSKDNSAGNKLSVSGQKVIREREAQNQQRNRQVVKENYGERIGGDVRKASEISDEDRVDKRDRKNVSKWKNVVNMPGKSKQNAFLGEPTEKTSAGDTSMNSSVSESELESFYLEQLSSLEKKDADMKSHKHFDDVSSRDNDLLLLHPKDGTNKVPCLSKNRTSSEKYLKKNDDSIMSKGMSTDGSELEELATVYTEQLSSLQQENSEDDVDW